uniref:AGC-kinase C-terminal domain-containing protein n=1 Tax=Caenorhabditis japonica TaxID=281687 RepID=A0A8R1IL23_CAEJA
MDVDARDFIGQLLEKKLEKRLGFNGVDEIKDHKFMRDVDWTAAEKRNMKPVIVPRIGHDLDTQFFSAEFTSQPPLYSPAESPLNANTLFR